MEPGADLLHPQACRHRIPDALSVSFAGPVDIVMSLSVTCSQDLQGESWSMPFDLIPAEKLKELEGVLELGEVEVPVMPVVTASVSLGIPSWRANYAASFTVTTTGQLGVTGSLSALPPFADASPVVQTSFSGSHHVTAQQGCADKMVLEFHLGGGVNALWLFTATASKGVGVYYTYAKATDADSNCPCFDKATATAQAYEAAGVREQVDVEFSITGVGSDGTTTSMQDYPFPGVQTCSPTTAGSCSCDCPAECGVAHPVCGTHYGWNGESNCYCSPKEAQGSPDATAVAAAPTDAYAGTYLAGSAAVAPDDTQYGCWYGGWAGLCWTSCSVDSDCPSWRGAMMCVSVPCYRDHNMNECTGVGGWCQYLCHSDDAATAGPTALRGSESSGANARGPWHTPSDADAAVAAVVARVNPAAGVTWHSIQDKPSPHEMLTHAEVAELAAMPSGRARAVRTVQLLAGHGVPPEWMSVVYPPDDAEAASQAQGQTGSPWA